MAKTKGSVNAALAASLAGDIDTAFTPDLDAGAPEGTFQLSGSITIYGYVVNISDTVTVAQPAGLFSPGLAPFSYPNVVGPNQQALPSTAFVNAFAPVLYTGGIGFGYQSFSPPGLNTMQSQVQGFRLAGASCVLAPMYHPQDNPGILKGALIATASNQYGGPSSDLVNAEAPFPQCPCPGGLSQSLELSVTATTMSNTPFFDNEIAGQFIRKPSLTSPSTMAAIVAPPPADEYVMFINDQLGNAISLNDAQLAGIFRPGSFAFQAKGWDPRNQFGFQPPATDSWTAYPVYDLQWKLTISYVSIPFTLLAIVSDGAMPIAEDISQRLENAVECCVQEGSLVGSNPKAVRDSLTKSIAIENSDITTWSTDKWMRRLGDFVQSAASGGYEGLLADGPAGMVPGALLGAASGAVEFGARAIGAKGSTTKKLGRAVRGAADMVIDAARISKPPKSIKKF